MKRREFLLGSAGAGAALAATGQVAGREASATASTRDVTAVDRSIVAQENGEEGNGDATVEVVEVDDNSFDPEELTIEVGTTVRWEWVGSNVHNVVPTSQPDASEWEGHEDLISEGEYEFTFDLAGTFEYTCTIHEGMDGVIEVVEDLDAEEPEVIPPAEQEIDPDEIGVPLQKHFIGISTFFASFLTLIFAFYVLKYGESPNTGFPERK